MTVNSLKYEYVFLVGISYFAHSIKMIIINVFPFYCVLTPLPKMQRKNVFLAKCLVSTGACRLQEEFITSIPLHCSEQLP